MLKFQIDKSNIGKVLFFLVDNVVLNGLLAENSFFQECNVDGCLFHPGSCLLLIPETIIQHLPFN